MWYRGETANPSQVKNIFERAGKACIRGDTGTASRIGNPQAQCQPETQTKYIDIRKCKRGLRKDYAEIIIPYANVLVNWFGKSCTDTEDIKRVARRTGMKEETIRSFYLYHNINDCSILLEFYPFPVFNIMSSAETYLPQHATLTSKRDIEEGNIFVCLNGSIAFPSFSSPKLADMHKEFKNAYELLTSEMRIQMAIDYGQGHKRGSYKEMLTVADAENVFKAIALTKFVDEKMIHMARNYFRFYEIAGIDEIIEDNTGCCKDLSSVLFALMKLEGINSKMTAGISKKTRIGHAWLEVEIGGKIYIADPSLGIFGGSATANAYAEKYLPVTIVVLDP